MSRQFAKFERQVWDHYRDHGRHDLPWRQPEPDGRFDPYKIMVSEIMLQQTQVGRVYPKYVSFIRQFPTVQSLAAAPLAEVLRAWSGLGYNRRAKFLWQAAGEIARRHGGEVPRSLPELIQLPGIGPNTAGAISAYSFNRPVVFIETNIRTVFIHHFFADEQDVDDKRILDLVAHTVPDDARQWYWALMDYGTYLKQTVGNLNKLSKHYTVQSAFAGSRRQIRGQVLRALSGQVLTEHELRAQIADERLPLIVAELTAEGFIEHTSRGYKLHGA